MDLGELLTRWTVRASLAFYAVGLALRACSGGRRTWLVWARLAWTGGCLSLLFHLICAFQFYHHWNHDAAYAATARQTEDVVGVAWGGGIFANYLFALVWAADVLWWWRDAASYQARSLTVECAIQGFLAFIVFNATVVFGKGAIRWVGLAACLMLAADLGYAAYRRRQTPRDGRQP